MMCAFVTVEEDKCEEGQVAATHADQPSSLKHLELDPRPARDGPGAWPDKFIAHVPCNVSTHTHDVSSFIICAVAQISPVLSQSTLKGRRGESLHRPIHSSVGSSLSDPWTQTDPSMKWGLNCECVVNSTPAVQTSCSWFMVYVRVLSSWTCCKAPFTHNNRRKLECFSLFIGVIN